MTAPADRLTPAQREAVLRWKLGHQVFHLLLVALNTRLDETIGRLDAGRWDTTEADLRELARLYDASTATMRYAADFPRAEYQRLVRPSMMPPFAGEGFSGQYNTDHARMLDGLRTLRRRYEARRGDAPEPVRAAWRRLLDTQRVNRRNHMHVCRRFVDDGDSLLQRYFRQQHAAGAGGGRDARGHELGGAP
ncbi:hypothetical protein ABGB16_26975 [Micromonospora sp. B11E3]|uniref:hypothetical protein n=1 Tax=Micromonospora sp. B11E3 TaxID=3153562 RepID=UPI00325ED7CB